MQFVKDAHHTLFRVWELGVSFLGRLGRQYSRADKVRLRWPGLFRPGHYLLDYLRFLPQELGMAQRKETPSPAPEPDPPPSKAC